MTGRQRKNINEIDTKDINPGDNINSILYGRIYSMISILKTGKYLEFKQHINGTDSLFHVMLSEEA